MRKTDTGLSLSATDLSNSVACRQLTGLDTSVALEGRKRPYRNDPLGDILAERGLAHEKAYAFHLKAQGRKVLDLSAIKDPADAAATLEAMRAGHDVIVQGALLSDDGRWYGRPDVLLRTEKRGTWPWSYEAVDTKLAQETLGTRLEDTTAQTPSEVIANSYPEPIDHCDLTSRSWRTRPAARDARWKQTASPRSGKERRRSPPPSWRGPRPGTDQAAGGASSANPAGRNPHASASRRRSRETFGPPRATAES